MFLLMTRVRAVLRLEEALTRGLGSGHGCEFAGSSSIARFLPPLAAAPWSAPMMGRARDMRCEKMVAVSIMRCAATSHDR